jgi:hypothetical protein
MDNPEKLARRKKNQKHNKNTTQYVLDTNKLKNVSKTWALLQTTGSKDEELFLIVKSLFQKS